MIGTLLAAGVVTLATLLALEAGSPARPHPGEWLRTSARLLPGVLLCSIAVVAAGSVPVADSSASEWIGALAPVTVIVLLIVAIWGYPRAGRKDTRGPR
ncbi:MAG: hypothetical protein ACRDQ7_10505 [Haloechinothrix sp.]